MQAQVAQKSETLNNPDLGSLRVLVVDDESIICETLQVYLQNIGIFNIQTAQNGEAALDQINRNYYNYIFLDLMMPNMSGTEILKYLSDHHAISSVIIMTGYPSMEIVIDAMHNGAADFLVKPFRFQDVKIIIDRIQKINLLMEKNWHLHEELEKKKEVEELNKQLKKRIRHQAILYNIIDSLSRIKRSEDLYQYLVKKAIESCNAQKACFMLYDPVNFSFLSLAQQGIEGLKIGVQVNLNENSGSPAVIGNDLVSSYFGDSTGKSISLKDTVSNNGFMSVPFKIREEPFGVLLVGKDKGERGFDREDKFILDFLAEKAALNIENMALYDNLNQSLIASLLSLISAIEAKDPYTREHSSRVTEYSLRIVKEMGDDIGDWEMLKSIGPLHDIGKIGINDGILNKPGGLTKEEYAEIKTHPVIGVNIVSPLGLDDKELSIIRNHHERWDGTGYPDGLEKDNTPLLARILAVADAFDAMNSNRAYRKGMPLSVCLQELTDNSGSQFDPEVVEAALPALTAS